MMMTRDANVSSVDEMGKGFMSNNDNYSFSTQMSPDNSELFPLSDLNINNFTMAGKQDGKSSLKATPVTPSSPSASAQYQRSYSLNSFPVGIDPKELIYVKDSTTNQV